MLSPGDVRLVARDTELPWLSVLLDAEGFASWLQARLPGVGIQGARARYLRYKPATSCLAAFDVATDRGSVVVTSKTFRTPAHEKLAKANRYAGAASALGPAVVTDPCGPLLATVFPFDVRVRSLRRLMLGRASKVLGPLSITRVREVRALSYKPERRFVGRVDTADGPAVVRLYSDAEWTAGAGRRLDAVPSEVLVARTLARHPSYPITATEWIEGEDGTCALFEPGRACAIGETLARLHRSACTTAWTRSVVEEQRHLRAVARGLADLLPGQAARVEHLAGAIGALLPKVLAEPVLTHGDFAARQVVFSDRGVALTDLDESAAGQAASDIGSFLADIDSQVVCGGMSPPVASEVTAAFLDGYASARELPPGLDVHRAAHLLRLAVKPFRLRDADWPDRVQELIGRCERAVWRAAVPGAVAPRARCAVGPGAPHATSPVDPAMPWLDAALDPARARVQLAELPWASDGVTVTAARVVRHKPGRRCLIAYQLDGAVHATVLGKIRARGVDTRTAEFTAALRAGAFGAGAADGIVVPEVLGVLTPFRMWLQAAAPGEPATAALGRGTLDVARRLGALPSKLQRHGPPPIRAHTLLDELRILEDRLDALAERQPRLRARLGRVLDGCTRAAATLEDEPLAPAHRDLHPDQVLVDGPRLVVLDLDLYALAHPALDGGNCLAHVIELGLRPGADARAVDAAADELRASLRRQSRRDARAGLEVFTTLTLARLLDIDDRLDHRRACVAPLLDLCERRLAAAGALAPERSRVSCVATREPMDAEPPVTRGD